MRLGAVGQRLSIFIDEGIGAEIEGSVAADTHLHHIGFLFRAAHKVKNRVHGHLTGFHKGNCKEPLAVRPAGILNFAAVAFPIGNQLIHLRDGFICSKIEHHTGNRIDLGAINRNSQKVILQFQPCARQGKGDA